MALLDGWDPLVYLDKEGLEESVADRVLERSEEIRRERLAEFVKAIEAAVQNGVARAFGGNG